MMAIPRVQLDPEDAMMTANAAGMVIVTEDDYREGWEYEHGLAALEDRINAHYQKTREALNTLQASFRDMVNGDLKPVQAARAKLRPLLGAWKDAKDREDRKRIADEQAAANERQREEQTARVAALERIAEAEPEPAMQQAFIKEAQAVAAAPVMHPPVTIEPSVPKLANSGFRTEWKCQFNDVRALLAAWLAGTCDLDDGPIIEALQSQMDGEADRLKLQMSKRYPGCEAVSKSVPITRKGRK